MCKITYIAQSTFFKKWLIYTKMDNPYKTKMEKIYNKKTKKDTFFVIMIHFPQRVWYNTRKHSRGGLPADGPLSRLVIMR